MSYTQRGDHTRVMIPAGLVVATAKSKTALYAYVGIARFADNNTGRSSCTVEQVAEASGLGRTQASAGIGWLLQNGWVTRLVEGRKGAGSSLYEVHMAPAQQGQRPESRTLNSASGNPDAEASATEKSDAETGTASGKSNADSVSATEKSDPEAGSASGKPDHSVRLSGRSLVSSLVSTTSSPNASGASATLSREDGSLPGLLVEASQPDPKPKRKPAYPDEFMRFWESVPRRRGTERGDKPAAFAQWKRVTSQGVTNDALIAAAQAYGRATNPEFVKDTHRWLKGELYETYLEQAQRHTAGDVTDDELDAVLGKALITLPAPPPGISHGTPAYREWKTDWFRAHRAERVRQYRERTAHKTGRSIA